VDWDWDWGRLWVLGRCELATWVRERSVTRLDVESSNEEDPEQTLVQRHSISKFRSQGWRLVDMIVERIYWIGCMVCP